MNDKNHHIEEILAHQERQIQDLNDMVLRQWHEIDVLKKGFEKLQGKINLIDATGAGSAEELLSVSEQAARDKPPHY